MDDCNLIETLGQVSSSEAGAIFRDFVRGAGRNVSTIVRQLFEKVSGWDQRTRGPAPEPPGFFQA